MADDQRKQDNLDPQTRSEIGEMGGDARKAQGADYSEMGQKGGQAVVNSGNQHDLTTEEKSEGGKTSSSEQDMSELGRKGGSE